MAACEACARKGRQHLTLHIIPLLASALRYAALAIGIVLLACSIYRGPYVYEVPLTSKRQRKMAIFASPTSVRALNDYFSPTQVVATAAPHSSHPSFFHLVLLVFEAVLEVICVSLPGYIAARQGMFDGEAQKLVANLNVMLFTPCLGTADKTCDFVKSMRS